MRALNMKEIDIVCGAGVAEEKGKALGDAIGRVVDASTDIFGVTSNFTKAFGLMGSAIGSLVELNFATGFKNLVDSIILTINAIGKEAETVE